MASIVVGFDLDMTLIDSRPGVAASFDALNAELGTDIDGAAIAARLGPTLESEMAAYFPADAFAAVRARDGITLVITAKYEPNAHLCLAHVGLAADHVVGWRHGPQKAETLQAHGAHVYVGDTLPDVHAARSAGARAVGVASGPVGADEL